MFLLANACFADYLGKETAYLLILSVEVGLDYWYEKGIPG